MVGPSSFFMLISLISLPFLCYIHFMNFKIAIVEDEIEASDTLRKMIEEYQKKDKENHYTIVTFSSASSFLFEYNASYDLVFMDIEMPGLNGMEAAKQIREKDKHVLIVFVTNMAQYAVEGYSVHAYDFILKPINYPRFSMKFERICNELTHQNNDHYISIQIKKEVRRIRVDEIKYVEVLNHDLILHMTRECLRFRGTMKEIEQKLRQENFSRCSNSFLVNLKYISGLKGDLVLLGEESLRISQTKRFSFLSDYALYAGGSK